MDKSSAQKREARVREEFSSIAEDLELELEEDPFSGAVPFGAATVAVYLTESVPTGPSSGSGQSSEEIEIRERLEDWVKLSTQSQISQHEVKKLITKPYYVVEESIEEYREFPKNKQEFDKIFGHQPTLDTLPLDANIFYMGQDREDYWNKEAGGGRQAAISFSTNAGNGRILNWVALILKTKNTEPWRLRLLTQLTVASSVSKSERASILQFLKDWHNIKFFNTNQPEELKVLAKHLPRMTILKKFEPDHYGGAFCMIPEIYAENRINYQLCKDKMNVGNPAFVALVGEFGNKLACIVEDETVKIFQIASERFATYYRLHQQGASGKSHQLRAFMLLGRFDGIWKIEACCLEIPIVGLQPVQDS